MEGQVELPKAYGNKGARKRWNKFSDEASSKNLVKQEEEDGEEQDQEDEPEAPGATRAGRLTPRTYGWLNSLLVEADRTKVSIVPNWARMCRAHDYNLDTESWFWKGICLATPPHCH